MTELALTTVQIGALSSIVVELFKLIPFLKSNKLLVAATVLVVSFAGTYFFLPEAFTLGNWAEVVLVGLGTYLVIIKPIAEASNSPTQ